MTQLRLETIKFEPPKGLVQEEVVTSWRAPARDSLKDPRLAMHTHAEARPNLTMSRAPLESGDLEGYAAHTLDHLIDRVQGVEGARSSRLLFADGVEGILLEYSFPIMSFEVVQLQALRVDEGVLTKLVFCTEGSLFTGDDRDRAIEMLASACVEVAP